MAANGNSPLTNTDAARDFPRQLGEFAAEFDRRFAAYLVPRAEAPARLVEAVRYSALAPGKRIRPYLVIRSCELAGGKRENAWPAAAAVECVHAFSLIHDDLPAMDDDDLRRGRPTCHKQFDEATAILAGDSLVVFAFELLAGNVASSLVGGAASSVTVRMIAELAAATGWTGMIGGQAADVESETQPPANGASTLVGGASNGASPLVGGASIEVVRSIHDRKTARLFKAACCLGGLAADAPPETIEALASYGQMLGRAFQIADDLLDVTATAAALGKKSGKDVVAGKPTYPRCVGLEESRAAAFEAVRAALTQLDRFDTQADDLRALVRYVVERDY